ARDRLHRRRRLRLPAVLRRRADPRDLGRRGRARRRRPRRAGRSLPDPRARADRARARARALRGGRLSREVAPAPEPARRRVPAAERREQLISAAVHEFARGGLHGTAVERIARRVGVAQPYVFSLFSNKRELFLAAVERSFQTVADTFRRAAADFREGRADEDCEDALEAMGRAYKELLLNDRDQLMLQHQAYAACDDELVRARVRRRFAQLLERVGELSGAEPERLDDFFRHGM